jgi:hypothetical protein
VNITHDREKDNSETAVPAKRAAIYLSSDGTRATGPPGGGLPIDVQRELCRHAATLLGADVVAEFVDRPLIAPRRAQLDGLLQRIERVPRLDYLIAASHGRLTSDEAFEMTVRLGRAGTVLIPIVEWIDHPPLD